MIAQDLVQSPKPEQRRSERSWSQDSFLNQIRKSKVPVVVFLVNGVKIQGTLLHFDQNVFILRRDGQYQLVYKHAVSTLVPQGPFFNNETSSTEGEN